MKWRRARRPEPFWIAIVLFWLAAIGLYASHLATGFTPGRVLLTFEPLQLDLYWYGFIIMAGIALGAWVVSVLAGERAAVVFRATVPARVRARRLPAPSDDFPAEPLARQGVATLGDLLWHWTMPSPNLRLNGTDRERVAAWLASRDDVEAIWLANPSWRRWSPDHVWNGVIWCVILAIVGARLYHVLTPSPSMAALGIESPLDYFRNPLQLINLRNGGLGIYGGIIGGVLGLLIYSRRHRLPALAWADLSAIGVALGQAVGRWGNFFNQELYGRPSTLPWAVAIEPRFRLTGYESFPRFHPAFLYESLWNFGAFLLLYWLLRRHSRRLLTGDLTAAYLVLYGLGRILVDMTRLDSRLLRLGDLQTPVPVATAVSAVVIVAVVVWRLAAHRRQAPRLSPS